MDTAHEWIITIVSAVICSASICRPLFLFFWPFPADVASYRQYESHQPKRKKKGPLSIFFCFSACVSPITYCIVYCTHTSHIYIGELADTQKKFEMSQWDERTGVLRNEPKSHVFRFTTYYISPSQYWQNSDIQSMDTRTGPSTSSKVCVNTKSFPFYTCSYLYVSQCVCYVFLLLGGNWTSRFLFAWYVMQLQSFWLHTSSNVNCSRTTGVSLYLKCTIKDHFQMDSSNVLTESRKSKKTNKRYWYFRFCNILQGTDGQGVMTVNRISRPFVFMLVL